MTSPDVAVGEEPIVHQQPSPVIAVTADPALADQLHRLAAAAGVDLSVRTDLPTPSEWLACGLLVVGGDLARAAATAGRPRGGEVVLVSTDLEDAGVWQHAVALGAEQVAVLPDAQDWLVERLAAVVEPTGEARVLGVVGGCGGAGASVLAAAVAVTAAEGGRRVLLVDLDPLGGGADLLLGVDGLPGLRWPDLAQARGRLPASSVHDALPRLDDLAVLAWGRGDPVDVPARAVDAVLAAACRGHDLVVLDLPRALDCVGSALRRLDELLVVVPARLRAAAAATQVVVQLSGTVPSLRVVVRRGAADRYPSRAVADVLAVPLALEMRDEPRLCAALDRGEPPGLRLRGPLRQAAERWLAAWDASREAA